MKTATRPTIIVTVHHYAGGCADDPLRWFTASRDQVTCESCLAALDRHLVPA